MDKVAKLNKIISEKNELLVKTAGEMEKVGEEMASMKEKTAELEKENHTLANSLEEANTKVAKLEKRAAARKLVEGLIEKGQVDPLKAEEAITAFTNSVDSIEKISELTSKLSGKNTGVGEIINKNVNDDTTEKTASDTGSTSDEEFASMLLSSFKKHV